MAYANYRGGREREPGRSIAMDPDGDASVAGGTRSTDFPVTPVAAQPANIGGHDAFIAKPDPTGQPFLFSPDPGGAGSESGRRVMNDGGSADAVVVESAGHAPGHPENGCNRKWRTRRRM